MTLPKFLRRKRHNPKVHGDSDKNARRVFRLSRSLAANQWILLATPFLVLGFGLISYAAFALPLNAPAGNIDYPGGGGVIGGVNTYISGWAVAATGINHVDVVVNGVPARASYGTGSPRPDVCALYTQSADCLPVRANMVGWQYYFNSNAMPNGTYSLYAAYYGNSGGVTYSPTQTFTVANQPPAVNIDTPSEGQTVTGTINIGGWAVDSGSFYESGISSLAISVDGVTNLFYPIYGAARQDVCNYYGYRANCPNVGFNYQMDTTLIPNGWRAMHLTVTDLNGMSSTYDRIVFFSNTVTAPPGGPGTSPGGGGGGTTQPPPGIPTTNGIDPDAFMDSPKAGATYGTSVAGYPGYVNISGWAVDVQTRISKVAIYLDGKYIVSARYGGNGLRPDVCQAHSGWFGCPPGTNPGGDVGWQIASYTSSLANGSHTVQAWVYDEDSHVTKTPSTPRTFVIANSVNGSGGGTTPPPSTAGKNGNPTLHVETLFPAGYGTVLENTGNLALRGWSLDNSTGVDGQIISVEVYVDGRFKANAQYGDLRSDVCYKYPNRKNCPNVGFHYNLDTTKYARGIHRIKIVSSDNDEPYYHTTKFEGDVNFQPPASKPDLAVDTPTANQQIVGTYRIKGWAIKPDKMINSVSISIGGRTFEARYGYDGTDVNSRQDICDKYTITSPYVYCPNVGYYYDLDTTALNNGPQQMTVTATAADTSETFLNVNINIVNPLPNGTGRNLEDMPDDVSGPQVHVMFVAPSDDTSTTGPDTSGAIEKSINAAQSWIAAAAQTNGHTIKFDTYKGKLDVSYFKSKYSTADFALLQKQGDAAGSILSYVASELDDLNVPVANLKFANPNKIYLMYFKGGPGRTSYVCGVGEVRGKDPVGDYPYYAMSFMYASDGSNGYCQTIPLSTSSFGEREATFVHETFHSMGLVQDCAPHAIKTDFHVNPSASPKGNNDLLSPAGSAPYVLDDGRDDYYITGSTAANIATRTNCTPNINSSPFMR